MPPRQLDYASPPPPRTPAARARRGRAAMLSVVVGLLTIPVCHALYGVGIQLARRHAYPAVPLVKVGYRVAVGGCALAGLAAGVIACAAAARPDARLSALWTAIAGVVLNAVGCVLAALVMEWD